MIDNVALFFKIFCNLLFSSAIASCIAAGVILPVVGFMGAPVAFFLGPLITSPAIIFASFVCLFMHKRDLKDKRHYMLGGIVIASLYALMLYFIGQIFSISYGTGYMGVFALLIGGFFTGWIYRGRMYSEKKGFRII